MRPKTSINNTALYTCSAFHHSFIAAGQEYGFAVDMWSAAATIFELATDQVLFKARICQGAMAFEVETAIVYKNISHMLKENQEWSRQLAKATCRCLVVFSRILMYMYCS